MLKVTKLHKSFGTRTILDDISFTIEAGEKVALVGHNGSGKSTLLKILAGLEEADSGKVHLSAGKNIAYVMQDTSLHDAGLSSGQKTKKLLMDALAKEPELLLLDEPTNNLDLASLAWLEELLINTKAACLIVSHDRMFLDRVATAVFELDANTHTLSATRGTYSEYLARKEAERARVQTAYRLQQEEISRLVQNVKDKKEDALRGGKHKVSDKDKILQGFYRDQAIRSAKTAKALEKRIDRIEKIEKPIFEQPFKVPLTVAKKGGSNDIVISDVAYKYSQGFKIGPFSLFIPAKSRIAIVGANGSGKSTLIKLLTGELAPTSGSVVIGAGVKLANLLQEHESLPREETVLAYLQETFTLNVTDAYRALVHAGLEREQADKTIATLSPGGRARLLMIIFSLRSINTLILDEPTNHLDIEALEVLETILQDYAGTLIVVSHDRYFLKKIMPLEFYEMLNSRLQRVDNPSTS
ncbi:MAG: ABC-F family ATP-binding cassette domain-containing protein [Candidatus Paceibacterota bacterium]|jgi:ATPase subunit of ABC transporter with duplicated ATPase domains